MENNNKTKHKSGIKFVTLLWIWIITASIVVTIFIVSQVTAGDIIEPSTFQILSNTLAFATFLSSTFFSFILIQNNNSLNAQNRKNSDEVEERNNSFKKLQFIASNYAAVDFVGHMLIYEVYKRYVDELKATKNFWLYMREEEVTVEDIIENFGDYIFVTVRIPVIPLVGDSKSVTSIRFSKFVFHDEEGIHHFVPTSDSGRNALVLYNKEDARQEVVVNLAVRKKSNFWVADKVNKFIKISFSHTMYSLLGVAVSGWTEIYFVNPRKVEKDGANKYTINSSQFEISGLPVLSESVEFDITHGKKSN